MPGEEISKKAIRPSKLFGAFLKKHVQTAPPLIAHQSLE